MPSVDAGMHQTKFDHTTHFRFGKNWSAYATSVTEKEIAFAITDLQRLLGTDRLDGLTILDIGCGSGLHSLSALRLGAKLVTSVDIDPDSVNATKSLLQRHYQGDNYRVEVGNIFLMDDQYQDMDIVYSWGVLHHTGDMWDAIDRASRFVKSDGLFIVAIYMKTPYCEYWRGVKKRYTNGSSLVKGLMLSKFISRYVWKKVKNGRNPFAAIGQYNKGNRGMHWYTDIVDWLGGYPYESATSAEVADFVCSRGFELKEIFGEGIAGSGRSGSGNIEYRFRRIREAVQPIEAKTAS